MRKELADYLPILLFVVLSSWFVVADSQAALSEFYTKNYEQRITNNPSPNAHSSFIIHHSSLTI